MARYSWQCISCGDRPAWLDTCGSRSIAAFIWDELAPSGWDQRLLRRRCKCGRRSLYITYRLKRGDTDRVSIRHLVGLALKDDYVPMLWETFRHSSPGIRWVDLKYQRARSPWGLTKRLVLQKAHFASLLRAYERASKGQCGFNIKVSEVTAIHEAAHAVAAIRAGLLFENVSAMPDDDAEIDGALYWTELHNDLGLEMNAESLALVLLAGPCAEARFRRLRFDRVLSGEAAMDDRDAIATLGLSEGQFIAAGREALAFIEREWPAIVRVAHALMNGKFLRFDEVANIVAGSD